MMTQNMGQLSQDVEISLENSGIYKLSAGRRLSLIKPLWKWLGKKELSEKQWKLIDVGSYILLHTIEALTFAWVFRMFLAKNQRSYHNSYVIHPLVIVLALLTLSVSSYLVWPAMAILMHHYSYRHFYGRKEERLSMKHELSFIDPVAEKERKRIA